MTQREDLSVPTTIIPDPPIPGVLKLRTFGTDGGGNIWQNTNYFRYTGSPPTITQCNSIASQALTHWVANFINNLPPPLTVEGVTVIDLSSATSAEGTALASTVGASTADKVPANTSVLISKVIEARYRGGRPRTYSIVVADENLLDPGHINSAYNNTMFNNYTAWASQVAGSGSGPTSLGPEVAVAYKGHSGPMGSPAYFPGTLKRLVPLVFDIAAYVVQSQLASQRGRIGRRT